MTDAPARNEDMSMRVAIGVANMMLAMEDLPPDDTEAFRSAQQKCSALINDESNPLYYLRYTGFDVGESARRLATYWRYRKSIMGARWYLPITVTGTGAIEPTYLRNLCCGSVIVLPNDSLGRPVWIYDLSKLTENVTLVTRMRFFLYWVKQTEPNPMAQSDGVRLLIVLNRKNVERSRPTSRRWLVKLLENAVPLRLHSVDFVSNQEYTPAENDKMVSAFLKIFDDLNMTYLKSNFQIHRGGPTELLTSLPRRGFSVNALPDFCGGPWDEAKWSSILRKAADKENEKYKSMLLSSPDAEVKSDEDDRANRRREYRNEWARRQRRLEYETHESLQRELRELQHQHNALQEEGVRLLRLRHLAQEEVTKVTQMHPPINVANPVESSTALNLESLTNQLLINLGARQRWEPIHRALSQHIGPFFRTESMNTSPYWSHDVVSDAENPTKESTLSQNQFYG